MLFRTFGAGLCGTEGFPVCCEADVENGFPQINFIGSLSQSVRESSDRVRTAIANTGLRLEPRHVTISLSPGDVRKEGCAYDLPVAAALLGAYGYLPDTLTENALLVGELSLGGEILPVNGVIAMVSAARDAGLKRCFLPSGNLREGSVVKGIDCYGVPTLQELLDLLTGRHPLPEPAYYEDPPEERLRNCSLLRVSPISVVRSLRSAPRFSLPAVATTSSTSALQEPERQCSLPGCLRSCRE